MHYGFSGLLQEHVEPVLKIMMRPCLTDEDDKEQFEELAGIQHQLLIAWLIHTYYQCDMPPKWSPRISTKIDGLKNELMFLFNGFKDCYIDPWHLIEALEQRLPDCTPESAESERQRAIRNMKNATDDLRSLCRTKRTDDNIDIETLLVQFMNHWTITSNAMKGHPFIGTLKDTSTRLEHDIPLDLPILTTHLAPGGYTQLMRACHPPDVVDHFISKMVRPPPTHASSDATSTQPAPSATIVESTPQPMVEDDDWSLIDPDPLAEEGHRSPSPQPILPLEPHINSDAEAEYGDIFSEASGDEEAHHDRNLELTGQVEGDLGQSHNVEMTDPAIETVVITEDVTTVAVTATEPEGSEVVVREMQTLEQTQVTIAAADTPAAATAMAENTAKLLRLGQEMTTPAPAPVTAGPAVTPHALTWAELSAPNTGGSLVYDGQEEVKLDMNKLTPKPDTQPPAKRKSRSTQKPTSRHRSPSAGRKTPSRSPKGKNLSGSPAAHTRSHSGH